VSLKVDWKIAPHVALTSVTAYDYGRWVEIGDDASVGSQIWGPDTYASSVNAYSEELRIASQDTKSWTWLAGAFFGHDVVHGWNQYHYFDAFPGTIYVPGSSTPLYGFDQASSYDQIRESRAVFANVSFDLTPTVTMNAGVRYTKDNLAVKNFFALEGGLPSSPPASRRCRICGHRRFRISRPPTSTSSRASPRRAPRCRNAATTPAT